MTWFIIGFAAGVLFVPVLRRLFRLDFALAGWIWRMATYNRRGN